MGIRDRDYMKQRPPDYDPDDGDASFSQAENNPRADKLNKRVTVIFGCVILGTLFITIIALAFAK